MLGVVLPTCSAMTGTLAAAYPWTSAPRRYRQSSSPATIVTLRARRHRDRPDTTVLPDEVHDAPDARPAAVVGPDARPAAVVGQFEFFAAFASHSSTRFSMSLLCGAWSC